MLLPKPLITLPRSFASLYSDIMGTVGDSVQRPALCLVCGATVPATVVDVENGAAACSLHVQRCSGEVQLTGCVYPSGLWQVGVFFLVQECCVLLVRRGKAAYNGTLYCDQFGEHMANTTQRGRCCPAGRLADLGAGRCSWTRNRWTSCNDFGSLTRRARAKWETQ